MPAKLGMLQILKMTKMDSAMVYKPTVHQRTVYAISYTSTVHQRTICAITYTLTVHQRTICSITYTSAVYQRTVLQETKMSKTGTVLSYVHNKEI